MESGAGTAVDPHALWAAAQRLDEAADLLCGALAVHLRPLRSAADPGVGAAVERLVADIELWQRVARDTALAIRTAADRCTDTEAQAAEALR
jgi:hypothetical protein